MLLLNNLPKLIQLVQLMKLQNNLCKVKKMYIQLSYFGSTGEAMRQSDLKHSETLHQTRLVSEVYAV